MEPDAILIVGAGPAGLGTARAYREAGGGRPVTLLGAEANAPHQRRPLTKGFLRGDTGADELPIEGDAWYAAHEVALRIGVRVAALDMAGRRVRTTDGEELGFAACVLATGSRPQRPPVPGADLDGVHDLRTGEDAAWVTPPGFWSTIGDRTLKHGAWGDVFDDVAVEGDDAAWAVRYRRGGCLVGVLAHERDDVYEEGVATLARRAG